MSRSEARKMHLYLWRHEPRKGIEKRRREHAAVMGNAQRHGPHGASYMQPSTALPI
ncbi:MAG: hypothetical protein ACFFBQ_17500 [Promethearchaeota archaeon]